MRLSADISFEQLLSFIRNRLSISQKQKLVAEIQKEFHTNKSHSSPTNFQKILLQGPTWSQNQYEEYLKVQEQLNQFGSNDSA